MLLAAEQLSYRCSPQGSFRAKVQHEFSEASGCHRNSRFILLQMFKKLLGQYFLGSFMKGFLSTEECWDMDRGFVLLL